MTEEWILFREFKKSNRYYKKGDILTVSNYGNVLLNGQPHECSICGGYYYLCHTPLHRIIAEKFLDNWDPTKEVDHKDCNKLNNMVTNLLISSHSQNLNNPLTIQHYRESHPTKPVLQYNKDNKFIKEYVSIRAASRQTKIPYSSIALCCKNTGRLKSAGGYIWKYKEE